MLKNPDAMNWANGVLQVLMHVRSVWAHVQAHDCGSSPRKCPAGILKQLSSELQPGTTWGNERSSQVFQFMDSNENLPDDAPEALTRTFAAIKNCEQSGDATAKVPVDGLVGIRSDATTSCLAKNHQSTPISSLNFGCTVNVPASASRTQIKDMVERCIAPAAGDIADYNCDQCKIKVPAKQTTVYVPPPPTALMVTLVRSGTKKDHHRFCVEMKQPVCLPGSSLQYNLAAVICCHQEQYFAVVKKIGAGGQPVWIKAEDNKVHSIKLDTLFGKNYGSWADILIYETTEGDEEAADKEAAEEAEKEAHTRITYVCSNLTHTHTHTHKSS